MRSIISSIALLAAVGNALGDDAAAKLSASECQEMDMHAIRLVGQEKLKEAAAIYERSATNCAPDPSRMTSRGVLQALLGETANAEKLISEAIDLAESRGDKCRADLSRGELQVVRGGAKQATRPPSCKRRTP